MEKYLPIILLSLVYLTGIAVQAQVQVVPQGIASINGSAADMGCTSQIDSGGVVVCNCSYLVDGISPSIDTSTSDWASQLVTVRRNEGTADVPFAHVLLTFGFDTAVTMTRIEIDLFNCSDWNIGAPSITLYLNPEYDLVYIQHSVETISLPNPPIQSSCNSLSTVTFSGGSLGTSYRTFHVLVDLTQHPLIQWLHVAEVRFIDTDVPRPLPPTSTMTPSPPPQPLSFSCAIMSSSYTIEPTPTPLPPSMQVPPTPASPTVLPSSSLRPPVPAPSSPGNSTSSSSSYLSMDTKSRGHSDDRSTTLTNSPQSSTPGMPGTPPSADSSSDNTLMVVLVAIIVGLLILALLFGGLIICIIVRRRSHCTKARYSLKTPSYELEKHLDHHVNLNSHLEATNPINTSSTDNSRYVCPNASVGTNSSDDHYDFIKKEYIFPVREAYYDIVARDEPLPLAIEPPPPATEPPPPTTKPAPTELSDDEFGGGHYDFISLPVTSPGAPQSAASASPVKKDPQPDPQPSDPPASSAGVAESSKEAASMYSMVQRRKAPKVPEKNTDLRDYLAVRIPFNENIYSESINPSDFISQQPEPEEETPSDPIIYAPIYPPLTVLPDGPESFELPAEVDGSNIEEKTPLRTGHYGEVVVADTARLSLKDMHLSKTETNKDVSITVAVKRLKPDATPSQRRAFETEARFLSRIRHPNVVRLLGACYEDPAFIMMEYMKDGDLSQFLQKYSEVVSIATPSSTTQITQSTLVYMACQIASGMKQLAALNFVHRDLATRNCLIGKNFSVKVASLGVDKNIYQSHYFRVQGNTLLPIRWMATECFDGKFSEKSDVWAFGVTMWEMFTLAKQLPYRHLSDEEVIHNALKTEYRLFPAQSPSCPQSVYEIMEQCWVMNLNERSTFRELHTLLQTAL